MIEKTIRFASKTKTGMYSFRDIIFGNGINACFRKEGSDKRDVILKSNGLIPFAAGLSVVYMEIGKREADLSEPRKIAVKLWAA